MKKLLTIILLSLTAFAASAQISVKVQAPVAGSNAGHFKAVKLKAGETLTYHAGDRLDLSVIAQTGW